MKNFLLIVFVLAVLGTVSTYGRYKSLNPCDWMEQDLAAHSGLPLIVVQARIRARFLLDGILTPTAYDCIFAWWKLRREGGLPVSPRKHGG